MKIKEKIFEKAEKVFMENGIENTSINMLTKQCGVSKGILFYHFKSKAHLVGEIAKKYVKFQLEQSAKFIADHKGTGIELLERYLEMTIGILKQSDNSDPAFAFREYIFDKLKSEKLDADTEKMYLGIITDLAQPVQKIIAAGQSDGSVRSDMTVNELAAQVSVIMGGAMRTFAIFKKASQPPDAFYSFSLDGTVKIVVDYLKPKV